jgi:hypothetical protein
MCQQVKPIQINNYTNTWTKRCRDCNAMMGMFTVEDANKIIIERDYYKKIFYDKEISA